jgi:hypothetical protein
LWFEKHNASSSSPARSPSASTSTPIVVTNYPPVAPPQLQVAPPVTAPQAFPQSNTIDLIFQLARAMQSVPPPPPIAAASPSPSVRVNIRSPLQTPRRESRTIVPSSPVDSDTDPSELVPKFISWSQSKAPSASAEIQHAGDQLREQQEDLKGIHQIQKSDWIALGVSAGLGGRLSRSVKKFQEERKAGRT